MKILIELPEEIENCSIPEVIRKLAEAIETNGGADLESSQLMDGSFPIDSDFGTVFVSFEDE